MGIDAFHPQHVTEKVVVKAADETVNDSAVLQNDDELLFAIGASSTERWAGVLYLMWNSGATPDFKFSFSLPASATMEVQSVRFSGGSVTVSHASAGNIDGENADVMDIFFFTVKGGGTAGNVQLQWAQNTQTASDTKVLAGSTLIVRKVAW